MFSNLSRLTVLAALAFASTAASAQEWTRLRGPNGSGISAATSVPVRFTEKDYNWRIQLPAEGHGSPVIWGNRVFIQSGNDKTGDRFISCLSTVNGKEVWTKKYPGKTYRHHQFNALGASTPVVDGDHVYVYLGAEDKCLLIALTHEGKEVWTKDLGVFDSKHGAATSPMLHDNIVVITSDQDAASFVAAFDRKTGAQKWRIERKFSDNGASYGVPCVFQHKGDKPQIIFASANNGMTGVDPETGRVNWEISDLLPMRVVSVLIVSGDTIVTNCGSGGAGKKYVVVRPGTSDGKTKPAVVWSATRNIPYVPATIALGDHLYTVSDGGFAACIDAKKGDFLWNERLNDTFFGSPIVVDGKFYVLSRKGDLIVYSATPEKFEVLARNPLGEASFATPAVADGVMYLRTQSHLISVGGGAKAN
ncbi:MAG: PQQ-binding-like beta-propeller repeat protein [Phycisphaeraceae bacterium]